MAAAASLSPNPPVLISFYQQSFQDGLLRSGFRDPTAREGWTAVVSICALNFLFKKEKKKQTNNSLFVYQDLCFSATKDTRIRTQSC